MCQNFYRYKQAQYNYLCAENEYLVQRKAELHKRVLNDIQVILDHVREPKDEQDKTVVLFTRQVISDVQEEIKRLDC